LTPQEYVQSKAAGSGSSFYYAFRVLPPSERSAITAFYAFCREVDDVVDEVSDPGVAANKLAWWDREVDEMVAGRAQHPVTQALAPWLTQFGLEASHFHAVIQGCRMDLQQSRYLDFAGLKTYCHLVAGVVGEVSARIFGFQDPKTLQYAHRLGLALQLTNILRDVGEDARRGRIYLPMEDLSRFQVTAAELLRRQAPWGYSDRFQALMTFQAERAQSIYDEALALLPKVDERRQRPGLAMGQIYRALLVELQRGGFQVLHQRTSLTPLLKLWIVLRTLWWGR
jgi:15-cis-phytoene synthase